MLCVTLNGSARVKTAMRGILNEMSFIMVVLASVRKLRGVVRANNTVLAWILGPLYLLNVPVRQHRGMCEYP